ncbi:Protein transport protein Sec16A [Araneus ventricosus]|uniref:Protein transport protein sec16 n=1 Tax=Araneus ventricosus TaxID=182803 RepID=A0A4Y2D6B1_ARAVE|nr:Protein transport protein Sec16A [Araneus ventricosus]
MSKRLLQRGRYPKAPAVEQISNTNSQFPPNPPVQTSQMSFFDPNAQTQTGQNSWAQPSYPPPNTYQPNQVTHQPAYPNPNTYQQNQAPLQPMPDSSGYWSGGQVHPVSAQSQWNESWYQQPENVSDKTGFVNYQQPASMTNSADQWQQQQQVPYSQIDNQNYPQQQVTYSHGNQQEFSNPTHYQSTNNNSQADSSNSSLPAWENGSLEVSQPEHLPWTYGAPQYSNPVPAPLHDFTQNSNSATNTMSWPLDSNYVTSNSSDFTAHDTSSSHYLLTNTENITVVNSENKSPSHSPSVEQNITSEDELHSSKVPNDTSNLEDGNTHQEQSVDLEYASSTLSAFFQNNIPDESGDGSDNVSTPVLKDSGESSQEERESPVLEDSVNKLSDSNSSLKEQGDNVGDENNFVQEEKIINLDVEEEINKSQSPSGFIEEPVNQEVPDPHQDDTSKVLQSQSKPSYDEISTEEPLNQEIPAKSGQTSRSTSSERERLILRPREDSPFKPPRPNSSKGMIVQQEISEQNHPETKYSAPEGKTVVQEVNLETFPDNLERPSDYEELKKQSPLYTSRKHLRSELNSSPSSLLCDNLDIPCVTLAPAAPPLSSARSDKSESSTESKSEMLSFAKPNLSILKLNEPNISSSSPDVKESNIYEKSSSKRMSRKESTNFQQSRDKDALVSQHKQHENVSQPPKEEKPPMEKNDYYNKPIYLKDSKINGSNVTGKDSQPIRQPPSNVEYPESSLPLPRNGKRDTNYPPDERNDPRYGRDRQEGDRHRFYEQKYPSFDERQCYSDRERSRPSSRNSLRDRSEDYPYPPRADDYYQSRRDDPRQYPPEYERPSSRMSETDASRNDRQGHPGYYRQQYGYPAAGYPRNDYYQRPPTHRGYDYDHYPRDPYYSSYYDAYRYAYSNYNYGFYDELYRNDPRYKQYQEQYRQYYAKHGYDVDFERSSVHSGRSSANEFAKDPNSSHYREPDIDSNESEISSYNLEQKYYGDSQNEMSNIEDQISTPSSRLTPVKFSYAHPIARFSPGGLLITGIPCQASTMPAMPIRIQTMQALREDEESFQELKNHQGPLIRGLTHKNDVIEFCNQKIKSIKSLEDIVDRDSYILLWELMVLLLRQNGSVAGSDIAELLLRDHEILRPSLPLRPAVDTPQGEHSPADVNDSSSQSHAGDASSPDEGIVVLSDKTLLNTSHTVDVDKLTRKFREFLLFGHKKDALEWAMKHGLWGHALFLASKMDVRTYANVMTRFANSLALNDPLQTLYQLMSGRQPLAVTNVADKKWGDWRPHLAMILSNPSGQPDVDSRSITTLGDTLASKGCLCAAHFCYIMAQVDFGTYEQKNSKLVLLAADHSLPFEEFASNEAVQLTEIYEYAQSLANPNYMLVHLQLYKFLYALRLVEHGFLEEALHYCEIISAKVQEHPHLFQLDFISEVYKLATQLKYHDPHFLRGQGEFEDQEDPDWMKNLTSLVQNFNNFSFGDQQQQQQQQQSYVEQPTTEIDPNQNSNNLQYIPPPTSENVSFQNMPTNNIQNEATSAYNHVNYYQSTGWNQQNVQNATFSSNNSPLDSGGYYQGDTATNQNSFYRQNSIPSHEENETTDVPSSPVTQTPPFDYFSSGAQQEWSSVHSLPSVSLSDACSKSDLEALVHKEETESDVALYSSSHSTPLHNYLLSKDNMDDRRMLMTRSGVVDVRTLNSCLKSSRSHNSKHKKCIKFDASVSQVKLQKTGIRRRRFSKKKSETLDHSDSSLEGSPSKEKHKGHHKLSLLQSLGIVKSNDSSTKVSKRKRKAKKKNETIEKLLQSKKTFAIDEPCNMNEEQWVQKEKSIDESVQETKKIISILKKLSDEEKKNSQLSQLMANELNKKPPLIFGGTYPIDEPFESSGMKASKKRSKVLCEDNFSDHLTGDTKANISSRRSKHSIQSSNVGCYKNEVKHSKRIEQFSREKLAKISPIAMFKRKHKLDKNAKDDSSNTSWTTTASSSRESSNKIENEGNMNESKPVYESSNTFNKTSHRERRDSAMSSGSRYSSGSISVANKSSAKETQKSEAKKSKPAQTGRNWLGGMFSRLLPKGPNQMILPDDKNPTIVWDEDKKCWKNTDSNDDDESNTPLAPPTDMELMGSKSSMNTFQTPGSSAPPSSSAAPPGNTVPPSSTSMPVNKFSRPKTRGMRQNYVDILNTSGSTKKATALPESLFPSPYESTSSPKLFMPDGTSTATVDNSADLESSHTPYNPPQVETQEPVELQTTPLMFDPAEYDNRKSSFSNQRPTLGRTGRRTYPT